MNKLDQIIDELIQFLEELNETGGICYSHYKTIITSLREAQCLVNFL